MMKRAISLILALALMLGMLVSCSSEVSEEERVALTATFTELLESSKKVNDLIFGEGILPKEDGVKLGTYTEADPESLADYGVSDIASIEKKVREVYSLAI